MIKYLYFLIVPFFSITCFAQQNRLSVNLGEISVYDRDLGINNIQNLRNNGIQFEPSLSYYRLLAKDYGIGLTVGYRRQASEFFDEFTANQYQKSIYKSNYKSIAVVFQPSVFEQIKLKKYLIILSANLPIKIYTKNEEERLLQYTYNSIPTFTEEKFVSYPKQLGLGLNLGGGIHRYFGKSILLGAEIKVGVSGLVKNGEYKEQIFVTENSTIVEINNITKINKDWIYRFEIIPSISLGYLF